MNSRRLIGISMDNPDYGTAVVKAILEDLRYAMIETYGSSRIMGDARDGGYGLFQVETLEQTGETMRFRLSIEITKEGGS